MSLLSVNDLNITINQQSIVRDVSLAVERGKILGIIGESGSGKSMTALGIMRLLPHAGEITGSILLDCEELLRKSEPEMCGIRGDEVSMVFQEPMTALNPLQTIETQVAETIRVHSGLSKSEAIEIARETLDRVGLPASRFPGSRYPHELSGGQRQRVVIAAAVARRPKLLIADEPTTALDVTTQAQILNLIRRLVDEDDMGAIFISHDLAVVQSIADDLAIMRHGEVLEAGSTASVFRDRSHPYTRDLIAASLHQPDRQPHATQKPLLHVSNVHRKYRGRNNGLWRSGDPTVAVRDVSFTIQSGESVGLVGESGCGKSTLTRAILGLDRLDGGTVRLDGEIITHPVSRDQRRKMQIVFQDPYGSFNPRHRVSRLVAEPLHLLENPPRGRELSDLIGETLEAVGLKRSDVDKYPHEFSGGQRQRIAIARAIILKPKLVVLDEAVSALDVQIRAQILDLLADISTRYALSYLFVSHDLHVVRRVTDRVLVMRQGQIVEEGPTESVFANPGHEYTRELIAATPSLEDV